MNRGGEREGRERSESAREAERERGREGESESERGSAKEREGRVPKKEWSDARKSVAIKSLSTDWHGSCQEPQQQQQEAWFQVQRQQPHQHHTEPGSPGEE